MSIQPPDRTGPGERAGDASPTQRPAEGARAADDAAETSTPPPAPSDIVDFSAEAGRLLRAREAAAEGVGEDAAARAELVERLRAQLAAGGYRVDPDAIARALAAAEDEL